MYVCNNLNYGAYLKVFTHINLVLKLCLLLDRDYCHNFCHFHGRTMVQQTVGFVIQEFLNLPPQIFANIST